MVDDEIIIERLALLRNELAYLKSEEKGVPRLQDYLESPRLRRAVERSLQVAIEACLDIGRRIISEKGLRFPEDNRDVFKSLAEKGLIPHSLLSRLVKMAQFRNLIIHNYARIDDSQVYSVLKRDLADFEEFARLVAGCLESASDTALK